MKSVPESPCELTGLDRNKDYLLYVTAEAGASNVSTPSLFRISKLFLTTPGNLELSELTHASVKLTWMPSTGNGGEIKYLVSLNGFLVARVNTPRLNLNNLIPHREYRVEVRAVNFAGISAASVISFKTKVPAPSNLRFSHHHGYCRVAWNPGLMTNITHEVSINGRVFQTAAGRWGYTFKLSNHVSGPPPHHFKFKVVGIIDETRSETSELEWTLEDTEPPSQPAPPVATNISDHSATVTWVPPEDNGEIKDYVVALNQVLIFITADTHFTFEKLTKGTLYTVHVMARDKDGNNSPLSRPCIFKTTGPAPAPQPPTPEATVIALAPTIARLEWVKPSLLVTGACIQVNNERVGQYLGVKADFQNLILNNTYTFTIWLFDIFGQLSEPTVIEYEPKDVTPPSRPGTPVKGVTTEDSVVLTWMKSTDDHGVLSYAVYRDDILVEQTAATSYTAKDLMPGAHTFEIRAMDSSGNISEPSSIVVEIEGLLPSTSLNDGLK